MASHARPDAAASSLDTPITIKVVFEGSNRKFKLPLQELSPAVFAEKIRTILQIPANQPFVLERFSDSGNAYITLDQSNPSAYKQLYRAAKAKLKLRIRATTVKNNAAAAKQEQPNQEPSSQASAAPAVAAKLSYPYSLAASGRPVEPKGTHGARDFSCVQARDQFFQQLAHISREREMGHRMKEAPTQLPSSFWQIFCNNCDKPMSDAHFHCSICDGGDYDLCETCVEGGKICPGQGHWLIKRFIKSGNVVTSATETVPPKIRESTEPAKAFKADVKPEVPVRGPRRTCNACVTVLPESALVTCNDCPDYDLCVPCIKTEQGHHPGHSFAPIDKSAAVTKDLAAVCLPGRHTRHHALCDGCDQPIFGVRHKCLNCPDWDYCGKCFENKHLVHPGHRFVSVYENLEVAPATRSIHYGILCDGPLCNNKPGKAYIRGVRYKCAVCNDTDFCANCEAHPNHKHNETHPLIKFKTPVRGAHVTLVDEAPGRASQTAGDIGSRAPATMSPSLRSVATLPPYTPFIAAKQPATVPGTQSVASQTKPEVSAVATMPKEQGADFDAHFVKDVIADGSTMEANNMFVQTWTIKNPGPLAWPVRSSVHFVGGDKMLYSVPNCPPVSASNETRRAILPGEEFDFTVPMMAPLRPGKHISYWRVKAPSGAAFGHKLWCDILVAPSERKSTSLADYQMQLMLLEQQNMKRLMMARQEHVSSVGSVSASAAGLSSNAAPAAPVPAAKEENALTESQMVFPTLEKESPSSSTLREAVSLTPAIDVTPAVTDVQGPMFETATLEAETVTTTTSGPDAEERFEDLESVTYEDSDDEDGFLTDEEYDILDASDEEVSSRRNGL